MRTLPLLSLLFLLLTNTHGSNAEPASTIINGSAGSQLLAESVAEFDEPWAMTFLPDGNLLVTEKSGELILFNMDNRSKEPVKGIPKVAYGGQGGLGDVILHPDYKNNHWLYLSYAEPGASGKKGAVVIRAQLHPVAANPKLENIEVIWQQKPKVSGSGHYSHRLAFSPDGYLFITSGDRQKLSPAQDWTQNLGKVIRLNADGSTPPDNPFQNRGELAKTFWSLGHRNLLGIAFDNEGKLWTHEMGPKHGDELNLTLAGDNYGWPEVSWGDHYSGTTIPDHNTRPEFHTPETYWVPTIAPSGLIIYNGPLFPEWKNNAFIGGLSSMTVVRVLIDGNRADEAERFAMDSRIREIEQGPDGAIWAMEDKSDGRLLRLTPYQQAAQ